MITVWSPTYQQIIFKHYHSDKHLSEFYLQDGGKINWHRYGTIITSLSRQVCSSYSIALHIYFRATRQPLPQKITGGAHFMSLFLPFIAANPGYATAWLTASCCVVNFVSGCWCVWFLRHLLAVSVNCWTWPLWCYGPIRWANITANRY